jgi:exopolyphosphatase/guanosine-5'-triphosphate,3'-diphosphate pyrophosphatase
VQESDELYLLSPTCDANVKVRDDLMDIKTLERVDTNRLEQWRPYLKAGFPLSAADVAKVCTALGVAPLPPRESYTLEQLQAELTHRSRGMRAVPVHKRRQRYTVGGCLAEMTDLVADGHATRTVAIESEDAASVQAAVREMGLDRYENLSYPRGLKRVFGVVGPRAAPRALRGHRRRDQLGEVPHRREARRWNLDEGRGPRRGDAARRRSRRERR